MSEELIRSIADEVVNQSIISNYKIYFLVIAISLISCAIIVFISSYFLHRGKQYATKSDFDEILKQLEETTKITEEIKSDIAAKSQDENNIKFLVRETLEAIFFETFQLELWFEESRLTAIRVEIPITHTSPMAKIEMYQVIYFKDARQEAMAVQNAYYTMVEFILDLVKAETGSGQIMINKDSFKGFHAHLAVALRDLREVLIEKYAKKVGL